jgi:hypothetical protein
MWSLSASFFRRRILKALKFGLGLLLIFVVLSACQSSPAPTVSPLTTNSPLTQPEAPEVSCLKKITPSGNTICGYLWDRDRNVPVANRLVFLADALATENKAAYFAALDRTVSPKSLTDANGMFYFTDMPTNMYFLMVDDYPQALMIHELKIQTNDLFVDFNQTPGAIDLGRVIAYNLAPDQQPQP